MRPSLYTALAIAAAALSLAPAMANAEQWHDRGDRGDGYHGDRGRQHHYHYQRHYRARHHLRRD